MMDDGIFLLFLFGITAVAFLSLILISYLIFCFVFQDDENDLPESSLPSQLKIDVSKYSRLTNFNRFLKLSESEKVTHILTTAYAYFNKPQLISIELSSTKVTTESLLIRDRGINSFYFLDYYDQIGGLVGALGNESENEANDSEEVNETTALLASQNSIETDFQNNKFLKLLKHYNYKSYIPKSIPYLIEDLIEINFKPTKLRNISYSTLLNLPIPTVNRKNDVIYFETKLLEFNMLSTLISIGLVTDPRYPNFQLPGYLPYSFAIESSGNLRMTKKKVGCDDNDNEDYTDDVNIVLPQLNEGDIIGLGYRSISGTIFLTHNGKLIHEVIRHFKFQMYPCIGIKNLTNDSQNCKINVNLGHMGFVYIEANVKKLGFCENKNEGLIGAPPVYNKTNQTNEILLDKGDEIPPDYPTDEDTFFGPIVGSSNGEKMVGGNLSLYIGKEDESEDEVEEDEDRVSTPVSDPPDYDSEKDKKNLNDQEYEGLVSVDTIPLLTESTPVPPEEATEEAPHLLTTSNKKAKVKKTSGKKNKRKKNKTLF